MKIPGRDAGRFCASPPEGLCGALLYGPDQGLVAARRQSLFNGVGPESELTRIEPGAARRAPASVEAALTMQGFFSGRPVVLIEGGTDGLAKGLAPVLSELTPDDGFLIVTADTLPARSSLRKLFETGGNLAAVPVYNERMDGREIETLLQSRGLTCGATGDALAVLTGLANDMDHGSFARFLDLIAIQALGRTRPIEAADIDGLAPRGLDGDVDQFVNAVAGGAAAALGPALRRLEASGTAPVGLAIALQRHFRMLLTAQTADGGIAAVRPPILGPRRDQVQRQMRQWNTGRLEQANRLLFETDGRLRSSAPAPGYAVLERAALRLAIMAGR